MAFLIIDHNKKNCSNSSTPAAVQKIPMKYRIINLFNIKKTQRKLEIALIRRFGKQNRGWEKKTPS